ncbi:TIGR04190 family B12-binding domain/radical SAM domain protein [Chloroflexota bacterium]
MPKPDLVLLHAPSVYDFRQKTILYGPVSDLVPPSPVFELYPIGITSIAAYLERAGYQVRIVNLAVRMLKDKNFDAEAMIKRLDAPVFGIDLHWMVHCHGAIEVAGLVKKYHPEARVVFGGLSSSYYYRELMEYAEIDYVLRGDSTEEPMRQLMENIKNGEKPEAVPNLVWRDSQGEIRENPLTHVPIDLSDVMVDYYPNIIRSVIRDRDLTSYIPFKDWLRYPITAVLTCRGCNENCVICGGSASAFRESFNRHKVASRPPESVARDVRQIGRFIKGPIFVLGNLCQPGEDYAHELLHLLQKEKIKNQLIFELFSPVSRDILRQMSLASPNFCLEISPESHDPEIRRAAGRNYSTESLEKTIRDALDVGCGRLDIFFLIGLPKQTPESVMENIDYCDYLLEKFKGDKRLSLFISPLSPFLDPGSLGFEQPERHGYRVLFRTLNEHRQALLSPSWKYSLNYETEWMTRHQIAETAYEAILRLNRVKAKHGVISRQMAEISEQRIKAASEMMHRIDDILSADNCEEELYRLKPEIDRINTFPVSEKIQLELPVGLVRLRFLRTFWSWLTGQWQSP